MSAVVCKITAKNASGKYITLNPATTQEQTYGGTFGKLFGPFEISLFKTGWEENGQRAVVIGVTNNDYIDCTNLLSGDKNKMIAQDASYKQIDYIKAVKNGVEFHCKTVPTEDLTLEVSWTR